MKIPSSFIQRSSIRTIVFKQHKYLYRPAIFNVKARKLIVYGLFLGKERKL